MRQMTIISGQCSSPYSTSHSHEPHALHYNGVLPAGSVAEAFTTTWTCLGSFWRKVISIRWVPQNPGFYDTKESHSPCFLMTPQGGREPESLTVLDYNFKSSALPWSDVFILLFVMYILLYPKAWSLVRNEKFLVQWGLCKDQTQVLCLPDHLAIVGH